MKKRVLSVVLAIVTALSLLPVAVFAAEDNLPDWYFLFAIFKNVDADCVDKNGKEQHITYSMTQDEVDTYRDNAITFEEYMNSLGIMRAHVDVVEIDATLTELYNEYSGGSYIGAAQATPFLESIVDLERYDHVTCIVGLDSLSLSYAGIAPSNTFENGTGISCIDARNWAYCQEHFVPGSTPWTMQIYVHEFLHFMERMTQKWGAQFGLHDIRINFYTPDEDNGRECYTDIILNRARGNAGTGVHPAVWQYSPRVLRTMTELTIPSSVASIPANAFRENTSLTRLVISPGVTSIGERAFPYCTGLTSLTIPSSVTNIGPYAFYGCTGLTEVTISSGLTGIEEWTFRDCSSLTRISIPASVTSIGYAAFYNTGLKDVYYGGTEAQWKAIQIEDYNTSLKKATIHYNSLMADVKTSDWFAQPVAWALENGVTNGTGGGNFSPRTTCTQGQILTFLWRAVGEPEPAGTVTDTKFYAKAAQWAKEQGLTDNFNADVPCTRAMVVTYLWKLAGSPSAGNANFSDVPASANYAQAVAWAVAQGVTNGTGATTFSPDATCTRGEIVTFLYRALG